MNIVELIRIETLSCRRRIAVIEGDLSITYAELLDCVGRYAATLRALGVGPGMRVGFYCRDGIDYIAGSLALLDTGAAIVPLADSLTSDEIAATVERTDVHGVLAHEAIARGDGEGIFPKFLWRPRQASGALDERCRNLAAAFIRFSSGTTGASKGVVLSHQSIRERTDAANRGLQITHEDVILWVLQMSHHFVVSILLFLRRGATIVVAGHEFPFSVLEAATRHPVTFIYASPVHYHLLASSDSVPADAMRGVRLAVSTAMKMPRPISEAFSRKFGFAPAEAYGIIEIGLPFVNTSPGEGGVGSVGRILSDYELQIRNPDACGTGEVFVRGKGMFDAYLSPWQTQDQCLDNGWFCTGDLGRVDEAGRLLLLGRTKTVIVCAGMKVFPEEVEEVINTFAGVTESLVSGKEHAEFGQVPVAQVVLSAPSNDHEQFAAKLRRHCFEKLSSYKVPVEFRVVPSLPRTASGKLARRGV